MGSGLRTSLDHLDPSRRSDEHGEFRLDGVHAGSIHLFVTPPDDSYRRESLTVDIAPGHQMDLGDLVLTRR